MEYLLEALTVFSLKSDYICSVLVENIHVWTRIAKRANDFMNQTRLRQTNPNGRHFLKQPMFLKHISETKTSSRFPLVLSEHADVV